MITKEKTSKSLRNIVLGITTVAAMNFLNCNETVYYGQPIGCNSILYQNGIPYCCINDVPYYITYRNGVPYCSGRRLYQSDRYNGINNRNFVQNSRATRSHNHNSITDGKTTQDYRTGSFSKEGPRRTPENRRR